MTKLIARFSLLIFSVAWTVTVLINAWGLEVKSWGWIIFGALVQMVILALTVTISKED